MPNDGYDPLSGPRLLPGQYRDPQATVLDLGQFGDEEGLPAGQKATPKRFVPPPNPFSDEERAYIERGEEPFFGFNVEAKNPNIKQQAADYDQQVADAWRKYQEQSGVPYASQTPYPGGMVPYSYMLKGVYQIRPSPMKVDVPPEIQGSPGAPGSTPAPIGDGGSPAPAPSRTGTVVPSGGSSGGGGSVSVSAQGPIGGLSPIMRDYDEQLQAMEAEKAARGQTNEAVAGGYGQAADEQRRMADEQMAREQEDTSNARRHLDEIGQLVNDYAQQKIDPMKWYRDQTFPQKAASVVGAMLAGWQGGPRGAQEYINGQIDRSIALQQEQMHRGAEAIGAAQNLYTSFLRTSENEQQAYDKTRAAMLSSAMLDVQKSATAAKTAEEQAQIDQLMAGLKLQRDMLMMRIQAQLQAGRGGAGAAPSANGLEVDPRSIATGTSGQQYIITNPAFSDDISLNLAQFGRLRDAIVQGQQVLQGRKGNDWWWTPYSDNINQGEAVDGAIAEAASKLASARGMPAGLQHVVQNLVPQFGSRMAGATAAKIPEVLSLLDQYEQDYLHAAGAKPAQITMGPGQGKEAGKLKYYARPGVVTTAPSQSPASGGNPLLRSFQPGS